MTLADQKPHSPAALFLVILLGVVMGNLSFPFLSPLLAQEMGSASLRFGLLLTGRLHTATIVPQIHYVASAVGILLALALWEIYHNLQPQQQSRVLRALRLPVRNGISRAITISLLFGVIVPCGIVAIRNAYVPAPSDGVLIANFYQHRQSFEQLRQMLKDTPQLEPVTITSMDAASILSVEETRYATYQEQLAVAGLKDVHFSSIYVTSLCFGSGAFLFELPPPMSDAEARATHERKSYIYSEETPHSTWRDTTPCTYRRIEGKWYLCTFSRAW